MIKKEKITYYMVNLNRNSYKKVQAEKESRIYLVIDGKRVKKETIDAKYFKTKKESLEFLLPMIKEDAERKRRRAKSWIDYANNAEIKFQEMEIELKKVQGEAK